MIDEKYGKELNLEFRHGVQISEQLMKMLIDVINGVPKTNMKLYGDKSDIMITIEGVEK